MQNGSPKDIARRDIMKLKISYEVKEQQLLFQPKREASPSERWRSD